MWCFPYTTYTPFPCATFLILLTHPTHALLSSYYLHTLPRCYFLYTTLLTSLSHVLLSLYYLHPILTPNSLYYLHLTLPPLIQVLLFPILLTHPSHVLLSSYYLHTLPRCYFLYTTYTQFPRATFPILLTLPPQIQLLLSLHYLHSFPYTTNTPSPGTPFSIILTTPSRCYFQPGPSFSIILVRFFVPVVPKFIP